MTRRNVSRGVHCTTRHDTSSLSNSYLIAVVRSRALMSDGVSESRRGTHPSHCRCRGTGWIDGPPIIEIVRGRQHEYTTVQHCEHHWWLDEDGWQPPLAADEPRALAAFERGYRQGHAERERMSLCPCEWCRTRLRLRESSS